MSEDLYTQLCDDIQQFLGEANKRLDQVKDALLKAGHPGVRLSNRKAKDAMFKIMEAGEIVDELPAKIGSQS